MNINAIALATLLGFTTPVITGSLFPSQVSAIPQFPEGSFTEVTEGEWSVYLSYSNNSYHYWGQNNNTGDFVNLSGAKLSGTSARPVVTWQNGDYRYQVAWQTNYTDLIRLQVFSPNGSEILNRLLARDVEYPCSCM